MSKKPPLHKALKELVELEFCADLTRLFDNHEALLVRNRGYSFYLIVPQGPEESFMAPVDSVRVHIYEISDHSVTKTKPAIEQFLYGNPDRTVATMDTLLQVGDSLDVSILECHTGSPLQLEIIMNCSPVLAMRTISMPKGLDK